MKGYATVSGYLCYINDNAAVPMELDTKFPCVVRLKQTTYNDESFHEHMKRYAVVVGYHSNQDPDRHLNCRGAGYPFQGRLYHSFECVGHPVIDELAKGTHVYEKYVYLEKVKLKEVGGDE